MTYHRDYAGRWFLTLAQGTDESRSRLLAALPQVLSFQDELFTDHPVESSVAAAGVGVAPSSVAAEVGVILEQVFSVSGVERHPVPAGRAGRRRDGSRRPAHRGALPPARRDAVRRPCPPEGAVVTHDLARTRSRRRRVGHRPGDADAHPRGPRRAPLGRGVRRPGGRDDHADVLRLPGDGDHARRPGAPARATPASTPRSGSAWRRRGRATGSPSAAGSRWSSTASPRPARHPQGPVGLSLLPTRRALDLPALRCGRGGADLGVRADGVQGDVPLHLLPRAVRAREGDLMVSTAPGAHHPRRLPHPDRRVGRATLRRRGRGHLRRARRAAGGVRLRGRAVTDAAPDHRRRGPPTRLLDLRAGGAAAARRRTADPRRPVLGVAGQRGASRRPGRGADPARQLPGGARRGSAPVHRRGLRHHADDVDRLDGAQPPRLAADPALRQPDHLVGDVRRGAGGPEEQVRRPARPRARPLARAA